MINSFYGRQDLNINNVRVGIRGKDTVLGPVDMSSVLQFGKVTAKAYNVNARMDAWVLPFLNVYALAAWIPTASTSVQLDRGPAAGQGQRAELPVLRIQKTN